MTSGKSVARNLLFYLLIPLTLIEQFQFGPLRATQMIKIVEFTILALAILSSLYKKGWLSFPSGPGWILILLFTNVLVLSSSLSELPRSSFSTTVVYLNGAYIFLLLRSLVDNWRMFYRLVRVFCMVLAISAAIRFLWAVYPDFGIIVGRIFFSDFVQANLGYQYSRKTLPLFDVSHLLFLAPLSLMFSNNFKNRSISVILYLAALVSVTMSVSRSYFISSVFGVLGLFFFSQVFLSKKYRKMVVSIVTLSVIAAGLGLATSTMSLGQSVLDRLSQTFNYGLDDLGNRPVWTNHSIWLATNGPLFGVGPGMFGYYSQGNRSQLWNQDFLRYLQRTNRPAELAAPSGHNPLTLLAEAGLIGFSLQVILYLYLIIIDFRFLHSRLSPSRDKLSYMLICIPSTYLLIIISLFDNPTPAETYFFYIARGILAAPIFKGTKARG